MPKTPLSPMQHKSFCRISLCIVVLAILIIIFAPGRGLLALKKQQKALQQLTHEIQRLQLENGNIKKEIKRLQTDKDYLERIAREKYGMLKENEMVFDFSKKKRK